MTVRNTALTQVKSNRRCAPYGCWSSTLSAQSVAAASLKLGQIAIVDNDIFWTEGRPQEQGRNVLACRSSDGSTVDLTAAPWNVRTRVNEYGGGAFVVHRHQDDEQAPIGRNDEGRANLPHTPRDLIFFCHFDDQRIYRIGSDTEPVAVTNSVGMRYADAEVDASRKRLIAVREDHSDSSREPVHTLVAIDLASGTETVLADGHDFYANPRLNPSQKQLAWLTWDHPNMPWDGSELWIADVDESGALSQPRLVAGSANESIFQPTWSTDGTLHFVSDRTGWWNLYREREGAVEALWPMAAEFGEPQWQFGVSTFGFDGLGRIVCSYLKDGASHLAILDTKNRSHERIETAFCAIRELKVGNDFIAFIGASSASAEAVVSLDLRTNEVTVILASSAVNDDASNVSVAEAVTFPSFDGSQAHAFFYAPCNASFEAPATDRPPLLVMNHGGPTGATSAAFRNAVQFWTQRGFAVVDVNYGGSTGFGRPYRERLTENWGVVDVEDAIHAARFLVQRGDVDPQRLLIRGSSAGGYTTLVALTFHKFFAAGASLYGIGDLEALARDTHKFESRYLDRLVGRYPEQQALYYARSPIHFTDRLLSALILFQGAEDKVVPPSQSEAMYQAVLAKGLPVAYLLFEHEQHGFRRAENIARALEAELYFYGKVLGFDAADEIAPVAIANLPSRAPAC